MQRVVSDGSVREAQVTRFNDRIGIASGDTIHSLIRRYRRLQTLS
jgi:hypothetical protein